MKNVLLIFPESPKGSIKVEMPSPGLAYVASSLKKKGVGVKILDLSFGKGNEISRKLSKAVLNSDYTGIYVNESVVSSAFDVLDSIKKINKDARVVAGGPLSNILYGELLSMGFDFAIVGEGEDTFYEFVSGKNIDKIRGLAYHKDDKIVFNGRRSNLNIDNIPFPDYSLFEDIKKYKFLRKDRKFLPLITSRGCSYDCSFCSVKNSIGLWRGRGVDNIIEEIIYQKKKHKVKEFAIMDDHLTFDMKRFERLCDELIRRRINIKWQCPNGISTRGLTKTIVRKMRKAGCWALAFAPEIGNEEKRIKKIGKNVKNSEFIQVTKWCNDEGIFTIGFFIVGFKWESKKDIEDTRMFIKRMGCDMPQIKTLIPFYSSNSESGKKDAKIDFELCKSFNDMKFCIPTDHLSVKQLERIYRELYLDFYTPLRSLKIIYKLFKNKAFYGVKYYIKSSIDFLLSYLF